MQIEKIDHLVLTVRDIDKTVKFYESVLGMQKTVFGEGRIALSFGTQKINLHILGKELELRAKNVQTGSADLCFIVNSSIKDTINHIESNGITIIEGPVERTGAMGNIMSVYIRDPDLNLIEVSNYANDI